eukprot:NODE_20_length_39102_cov_0.325513.p11 type:complete len:290 gc:universal NODE_20_length_39102_cov_0.325513:1917-2786(+)
MTYEKYDTLLLVKKNDSEATALAERLKCTHVAFIDRILKDTLRTPQLIPIAGDFENYWARTKQFGIFYCWYPLKTMFSKGNHFEKQVIGKKKPDFAIDLCAGIGYWVFPLYANGRCVIACEWNPYSIVGMIIGANMNRCRVVVMHKKNTKTVDGLNIYGEIERIAELLDIKTKIYWKFNVDTIDNLEKYVGQHTIIVCPGNHHEYASHFSNFGADLVMCGLLPTSKSMWDLAKSVVSKDGEIIIHECATSEENLYNMLPKDLLPLSSRKVKNYAPKLFHYVVECSYVVQ